MISWLLFSQVHKCGTAALGGHATCNDFPAAKDRRGRRSHIQVFSFNLSFFHNLPTVRGCRAVKEVVLKIATKRDGIGTVLTFSLDQASPDNIPLDPPSKGDFS